jgi:hypothetical protein
MYVHVLHVFISIAYSVYVCIVCICMYLYVLHEFALLTVLYLYICIVCICLYIFLPFFRYMLIQTHTYMHTIQTKYRYVKNV